MSSPQGRQAGSFGDELTNAALIGLVGMFGVALVLRASGSVAAFLTGTAQPNAGLASGLGVLFNPADPAAGLDAAGLNPVVYWIVTAVLLAGLCVGGGWVRVRVRRHTRRTETDPRRLAGTATSHEVSQTASGKALLRRAGTLRPSLEAPAPADVGYLLGASHGKQVWASVEDSILLLGPPRSGKGLHVVINAILDAPGAVVTTSTRPDNLTATLRARERDGAQAREKWGDNAAGAIWDASIVKIILGGASNSRDLQDLSSLIGEHDEYTDSVTLGDHGTRSNQRSIRRVPILPPDRIRTLPFGTGITLLRSAPPIVTDLRAWPTRPDATQLGTDRSVIEALLWRPAAT